MYLQNVISVYILNLLLLYSFFAEHILEKLSKHSTQDVKKLIGNHSLLIIAHPDDESMFFGPTIINLLRENKYLTILCLTAGSDADSGQLREKELRDVVDRLGSNVDLTLLRDPNLPDSMTVEWDLKYTVRKIQDYLLAKDNNINSVISFDNYGVSGHINHRSIHSATEYMASRRHYSHDLKYLPTRFFILKSVSLWRKYTSFLDSVTTWLKATSGENSISLAISLVEHNNLKEILRLHRSQMVWFRQIYMLFSRYMFINDLELLN